MIYRIEYSTGIEKQIKKLKNGNNLVFNKLKVIINELMEHPRTGTGHPEPLKGYNGVTWSRHLTKKDRIIYEIYDDIVVVAIVQIGNHYNDK